MPTTTRKDITRKEQFQRARRKNRCILPLSSPRRLVVVVALLLLPLIVAVLLLWSYYCFLLGTGAWKEDNNLQPRITANKRNNNSDSNGTTIFYNIYIPSNNKKGTKRAVEIVREQIQQVLQSAAVASPGRVTHLYYVTIGQGDVPNELMESNMNQAPSSWFRRQDAALANAGAICSDDRLQCHHVHHYHNATEAVTLQALYDHCRQHYTNDDNDNNNKVVYLHSKGSFHANAVNDVWRRHLTAAALHERCLLSSSSSGKTNNHNPQECNICGLQFYTEWTLFFPGNMWTADCTYVNQLIPPQQFSERQEEAIGRALLWRLRGWLHTSLYPDRMDRFGLDRYSTEHWIGSHPDIKPCEVASPRTSFGDWLRKKPKTGEQHDVSDYEHRMEQQSFDWGVAPRRAGAPADNVPNVDQLWQRLGSHQRITEYYYLAGHLLKWLDLYAKIPAVDSWVWSWFPDGVSVWKKAILLGNDTDKMAILKGLLQARSHNQGTPVTTASTLDDGHSGQPLLFGPINQIQFPNEEVLVSEKDVKAPSAKLVVFVHMDLTTTTQQAALGEASSTNDSIDSFLNHARDSITSLAEEIIMKTAQNDGAGKKNAVVLVYYHIFGASTSSVQSNNRDVDIGQRLCMPLATSAVECRSLPVHRDSFFLGETLQHLYDYCAAATSTHRQSSDESPRVVFLHNRQLLVHAHRDRTRPARQMDASSLRESNGDIVTAVTSKNCWGQTINADSHCNLCGQRYFTAWGSIFTAQNMWMAPCSYIRQLHSPRDFVARMETVAQKALVRQAKNQFVITDTLYSTNKTAKGPLLALLLGLDEHVLELHWVASHPMVQPCESVAPPSSVPSASWWPQRQPWYFNATLDEEIRHDPSRATREYAYLAGRLFQWFELYGQAPPASSWIWSHYPNGAKWRQAVETHQQGAIWELIMPFANTKV